METSGEAHLLKLCRCLNSKLKDAIRVIESLQKERNELKTQLHRYKQASRGGQTRPPEEIIVDEFLGNEIDTIISDSEWIEAERILSFYDTDQPSTSVTADNNAVTVVYDGLVDPNYLSEKQNYVKSERIAEQISAISNSDRLDAAEEFRCLICDKNFKTMKILRRHNDRQHMEKLITDDRTFECYHCHLPFQSQAGTRLHLNKSHVISQKAKCSVCRRRMSHQEFERHLCFGMQAVPCEYCSLSFTTTRVLLDHLDSMHDEKQLYRCEHCPRFFAMTILKEHHTKQHTTVAKTFACSECPKRYVSRTTLLNHMKTHTMEQSHLCEQCGKEFNSEQRLKIHRLVHEEPKFACSHCPQKFRMKGALDRHNDLHRNIKYVCDVCGIKLGSYFARYKHMKKHFRTDADKKYKCETCEKCFYRRDALKAHVKSHTQEKSFQCDYCDKVYRHLSDLNKHLRLHLGENIHKCKICPKAFRLPTELKQHSYKHYRDEKELPPIDPTTSATSQL